MTSWDVDKMVSAMGKVRQGNAFMLVPYCFEHRRVKQDLKIGAMFHGTLSQTGFST
jgi:hypothetical protein